MSAARGGRVEGRSPGLATLKEAFDITYAVHRMEEEGARRRKYKGRGGAGARGFLQGLNEDDEEEEEEEENTQRTGATVAAETARTSNVSATVPTAPSSKARRAGPGMFELDMDSATLLGRRHKRVPGAGSPLAGKPFNNASLRQDAIQDPGSPMRV